MKDRISFQSIPGPSGGEVCLSIYPPGTFCDNTDYAIFIGGCSVGHADSEADAILLLASKVRDTLEQYIKEYEFKANYYKQQLAKFKLRRK